MLILLIMIIMAIIVVNRIKNRIQFTQTMVNMMYDEMKDYYDFETEKQ